MENDKNCYQNCSFYYYLDGSNTYHCTSVETCPSPYNILIPQKGKCIDECKNDNIYKYYYHGTCSDKLIDETTYIAVETTVNNIKETTQNNMIETTEKNMMETTEKNMMETTQKNIAETNNNEDQINIAKTTNENIISETSNKEREETQIEYKSITNEVKYQCLNDNSLINKCIITHINNVELYNFLKNDIL